MDEELKKKLARIAYENRDPGEDARLREVAEHLSLMYPDKATLERRVSELMDDVKYRIEMGDVLGGLYYLTLFGTIMLAANGADDDFIAEKFINRANGWMKDGAAFMTQSPLDVRMAGNELAKLVKKDGYKLDKTEFLIRKQIGERIDFLEKTSHKFQFETTLLEFLENQGGLHVERARKVMSAMRQIRDEGYTYMQDMLDRAVADKGATGAELTAIFRELLEDSSVDFSRVSATAILRFQVILMVNFGFAPFELLERSRIEWDGIAEDDGYVHDAASEDKLGGSIDQMRDIYYRSRGWDR